MSRSRIVKPEFFRHSELYRAEVEAGLPLRLAFEGLWTVADREGRFVWKPTELKLDVLPYDPVDFGEVLDALEKHGFIVSYVVDGKRYAHIPSFLGHQTFHPHEAKSKLPAPTLVTNGEQCQPVSISVSTSISASTKTEAKASGEADRKTDLGTLMGAIRKVGYRKATTRRDEMRDYSVAKAMLASHPVETCLDAIEGTRKLVGESEHFTLRLVWAEGKDGGPPMFTRALDAVAKPAGWGTRERTGPMAIGDLLKQAG